MKIVASGPITSWEIDGETEDKIAGWHHQLKVHEFEQAAGDGNG